MIALILSLALAMGNSSFRTADAQITIETTARVDFFRHYNTLDEAIKAEDAVCTGASESFAMRHVYDDTGATAFWTVSCEFDN